MHKSVPAHTFSRQGKFPYNRSTALCCLQRLERGEITKPQVLTGRFRQFFSEYGIDTGIAVAFNDQYQPTLGDTIVYHDDSLSIVKALKGKVKQYVVSNGTVVAQTKKLQKSGLGKEMDGVFLSERLGVEKPNTGFLKKCFFRSVPTIYQPS